MSDKKPRILIVDDEKLTCELLQEELTILNYECDTSLNANEALIYLNHNNYQAILLDIRLPDIKGTDLLKRIVDLYPLTPVIMLTAVNDLETAVESMKIGATDYITKPFRIERIEKSIQTATGIEKQSRDNYQDTTLKAIQAIALGVEARQEMIDIHYEIVTQQTINIAQKMGFPPEKIQQWATARAANQSKKVKKLTDSVARMSQNPAPDEN